MDSGQVARGGLLNPDAQQRITSRHGCHQLRGTGRGGPNLQDLASEHVRLAQAARVHVRLRLLQDLRPDRLETLPPAFKQIGQRGRRTSLRPVRTSRETVKNRAAADTSSSDRSRTRSKAADKPRRSGVRW